MNRWTMEIPGSKLLGPQVMEQTNRGSYLHGTGVSFFFEPIGCRQFHPSGALLKVIIHLTSNSGIRGSQ